MRKRELNKELRKEAINADKILNDEHEETIYSLNKMLLYYQCAMLEVEAKFKVLDMQFNVNYDRNPIETIKSRLKTIEAIIKKLRRNNMPLTLESVEENIWDIAGIRVICSFKDDIYFLVKSLLKQDDIRLFKQKDYIKNPKVNGYRSLHLIVEIPIFLSDEKKWVKAEIQFRTIAMDFWASLEHKIRYKKKMIGDNIDKINSELLECAYMCSILDNKMQEIKNLSNIEHLSDISK